MRSISISSLESTVFSCDGVVVGVETIAHLGMTLIASSTTLIFIHNGQMTKEVKWREIPLDEDRVVLFGVMDNRAICIYSSGVVSSCDCESGEIEESMLSVESEVMAASINGVNCVISLVLSDYTMTIIDSLFDIIVEGIDLKTTEMGIDQLVTVGWGNEKTQFQGKGGKEQREKKVESREAKEENRIGCRVEWRGDGEIFLVNYYDEAKMERECTIWNGNGQLVSRLLCDLRMEEWSSFRPMGNMIGVGSEGRIIMAERNGQKRNGSVNINKAIEGSKIKDGGWNIDGSVLAIQVEKTNDDGTIMQYLMFWMCANFDWSCKLVVPFEGDNLKWKWNSEIWNEINVVSPSNELFQLMLSLPYHSSNGVVCTMGVSSIRLTNLNRLLIPPPLSEYSISQSPPSVLFFSSSHLILITSSHILVHHSLHYSDCQSLTTRLHCTFPLSLPSNSILTSLSFINHQYVVSFTLHSIHYTIFYDGEGKEVKREAASTPLLSMKKELDGSLSLLTSHVSIRNNEHKVEGPPNSSQLIDYRFSETGMGMYTLVRPSSLFNNGSLISTGVSSFAYSNPFLAWIDNEFLLHVIDTTSNEKAEVRRVEKGATLVSIAPPKVILQMPRGNLETIHSRFFLGRSIRSLLSNGEVKKALIDMRKHGISFTLLKEFDHLFSSSIDWLNGMDDSNLLSLLITEFRSIPEYSSYCDLLSSSILSLSLPHALRLFSCVLTSYLLSTPSKTIEAFQLILNYLPNDSSRSSTLRNWLQICSFTMNSSTIFKSSLSTYNLPFVVEVVEALSIDPNEYMNTLSELNQLSEFCYRAYKMDLLREDWSAALLNLSKCDPPRMDEVIGLISSKSLHSLSLRIYGDHLHPSQHFNTIGKLAMNEYCKEGKWVEGSMIGRMIGEYEEEMKFRQRIGDVDGWIEALEKRKLNEDENKMKKIEWKNILMKTSKWDTVIRLLKHMDCGWEERMEIMEKGRDWKGIVREIEGGEENENEEMMKRGRDILRKRSHEMQMEIEENTNQLLRLSTRLNVVREKKKDVMERVSKGGLAFEDMERCDAFSESSLASSRSSSSRSSRASAMSRRTKKVEKKKQSLKEGGEWEDAAILIASHSHWDKLRKILVESRDVMVALIYLRLFSSYSSLSSSLNGLECTLIRLSPLIWPSKMLPHHITGPLSHIYEDGVGECGWDGAVSLMPSSFSLDPEMSAPAPLSEQEKAWRIKL